MRTQPGPEQISTDNKGAKMIKLYGMTMSAHTRKVQQTLLELGCGFEFVVVDLMKGEQHKPGYMALNPGHKTPTLVDGEQVVVESNAILLYLADTYNRGTLIAQEGRDRWQAIQWLVWAAAEAHGPLSKPWYEKVLFPLMGRPLNETALSQAYEDAKEPLRVMEAVLSRQSYFGGQAFSIADIALAESVHLLKWGGMDPSAYSHVAAWFEKASARPAYVSTRFVGQST